MIFENLFRILKILDLKTTSSQLNAPRKQFKAKNLKINLFKIRFWNVNLKYLRSSIDIILTHKPVWYQAWFPSCTFIPIKITLVKKKNIFSVLFKDLPYKGISNIKFKSWNIYISNKLWCIIIMIYSLLNFSTELFFSLVLGRGWTSWYKQKNSYSCVPYKF